MSENVTLTLRGRIATDLRTYTTTQGTLSARFRLAVPQWRITDAGTFEERDPHWYTVRVWDRLATHVVASARKGTPVIVVGKPTTRAWSDENGQPRAELVVNAQSVGIDLAYGVAQVLRPVSSSDTHLVRSSERVEACEYQVHGSDALSGEKENSNEGRALIPRPRSNEEETGNGEPASWGENALSQNEGGLHTGALAHEDEEMLGAGGDCAGTGDEERREKKIAV